MKIFSVLFVSLAAIACGTQPTKTLPSAAATGTRTIDVVRVAERPLGVTVSMPGELDPYQTVAIFPRVTGFVKAIGVDRGSRVRAGDLIATLEAPELVAQRAETESKFQSAEAQLATARSKVDGSTSTYDKLKAASATPGVVAGNELVLAQKTVEADQSQVIAAQQNVEAARQELNSVTQMEGYLRVTAPFDGVVTERNVHPGALVGPGSGVGGLPIVRIVENSRLRLVVPVPEGALAGVSSGAVISFSVAGHPGETFSGTVARMAQTVDIKTRTMAIELDVANRDGRLASGAFCQVQWPIRRSAPSLFVPSASVASTTDRTFVIRIRSGRTEWVDVKTGVSEGGLIEVFGDLHGGDQIAARGTDELLAGIEVNVKEVKAAS